MPELYNTPLFSDANLIAYYRLANTSDSKGSFTLTNYNSVGFATGKFGNGANYGAANTNKYLGTTNTLGINGGAMSMSLWWQNNGTVVGHQMLDVAVQGNTSSKIMYRINYDNRSGGSKYKFYRNGFGGMASGTTGEIIIDAIPATSGYDHLVLTYDGTTLKGYLNGKLVGSAAASGNGAGWSGMAGGFLLGAVMAWDGWKTYDPGGFYASLSGVLDDVAVFNRALTAAEVSLLYGARFSPSPAFFSTGGLTLL